MRDHDDDLERFEALLERSSLGTPGARRLRRRTSRAQVEAARRISRLQEQLTRAYGADAVAVAAELIVYLLDLGYERQADEVRHGWPTRPDESAAATAPSGRHSGLASASGSHDSSSHGETGKRTLRAQVLTQPADVGQDEGVSLTSDIETSVFAVSVRGMWTRELQQDTRVAVHKAFSQSPRALILDLAGLTDGQAISAAMWLTAARAGKAMDPPIRVLVSVPASSTLTARLERLGVGRLLEIFPSLDQARAAVQVPPSRERLELAIRPDSNAAPLARALVTDACSAWDMPSLLDRGRLVISELVMNAVEHAGTSITVRLARRGSTAMHIAVQDEAPSLPRLIAASEIPTTAESPPRVGLRIVDAAASSWGAMPARNGKIVWALLKASPAQG